MHLKRWLTALVGVPALILVIGPGPRWVLYAILLAAAVVALLEFYRITEPELPAIFRWSGVGSVCAFFAAVYFRHVLLLPAIAALTAFAPMVCHLWIPGQPAADWTARIGRICWGPFYAGIPLVLLMLIDMRPSGNLWIFFLLTVVFAGDTFAYYVGKGFGKRKLNERISPGKTWAGAIGGAAGSLIGGILFIRIFPIHPLNLSAVILTLVLAAAGQVGDLAESLLKRSHGIKDSGAILPGHGGLLDRIDALIFAIPILYGYLYFY